jgi:hypothetical protein
MMLGVYVQQVAGGDNHLAGRDDLSDDTIHQYPLQAANVALRFHFNPVVVFKERVNRALANDIESLRDALKNFGLNNPEFSIQVYDIF